LFKRVSIKIEWVIFILVVGLHLYAVFAPPNSLMNWFTSDDGFYYFKTAQNIAEGRGVSFDGLAPTNGFHPLWMAVLVPIFALARLDLILPLRIVLLLMTVLNAGSAVLLYRIVRRAVSPAVGVAAAVFWAFFPDIHKVTNMLGMESGLYAFFLLLLLAQVQSLELRRAAGESDSPQTLLKLGITAALLLLSRLDNIFLVAVMGIWVMFRSPALRYLLLGDLVLTLVSVFASYLLRLGIGLYFFYSDYAVWMAVVSLVMRFSVYLFFGLYGTRILIPNRRSLWRIAVAASAASALVGLVMIVLTTAGAVTRFPRTVLAVDWALGMGLAFALRYGVGWVLRRRGVNLEESAPETDPRLHWKPWLQAGLRYYGPLALTLAVYLTVNVLYAGTPMPVSGQIKRWWGTMANTVYERPATDWYSFLGISTHTFNAWDPATDLFSWLGNKLLPIFPRTDMGEERYYIAMSIFVILGLILVFANKRRTIHVCSKLAFIPLITASGIQILSYSATSYGGVKEWYWISEMILITLAGSFFIDLILRPLLRIKFASIALQAASLVVSVLLAYNLNSFVVTNMLHNYYDPNRPYMDVLQYLETNTEPGNIIGMTGGGNVGYFIHDRTIINMDGLINSNEYFHILQNGEAPTYLRERGMTRVFANAQLLALPPYYGQYAPYLERYSNYGGKGLFYLLEEPKY